MSIAGLHDPNPSNLRHHFNSTNMDLHFREVCTAERLSPWWFACDGVAPLFVVAVVLGIHVLP
jgi:hypothetical protein